MTTPLLENALRAEEFLLWCEHIGETKLHPWMRDILTSLEQLGRFDRRLTQLVPKGPPRPDLPKSDYPHRDRRMAFANAAGNHGVMIVIDDPVRRAADETINDALRDTYMQAPKSPVTVHLDVDHIARLRMLAPPAMGKSTYHQPMIPPGIMPETNRAERRAGRRNKPKQHLKGLR